MIKSLIKKIYYTRIRYKPKIFCISIQRTGTTSVGEFFKYFNFRVATWGISNKNNWSIKWNNGVFESIFNSLDFKINQVFEDDPWWLPDFYKVLYHRFPKSKFILFTRDSNDWFKSMKNHSEGKTLGNTFLHCKIYRREFELYELLNRRNMEIEEYKLDNLLGLDGKENHYRTIYELHNREVIDFFERSNPASLFVCDLKDPDKWQKLGKFIGIDVPKDLDIHINKSKN